MAILPVLKVDDVVVGEGGGVATFTLRLSQPSASTVSVTVGTAGGTATASSNDYSPLVGVVVNFAPGETEKQVSVPITDDATSESPESLFLNLFSPQGLVLGRSTVTATIVDNDTVAPAPYVLIDDTVVSEGDGLARFTLRLNHATATALIVTYQTANGSAVAGSDYTALTSSVTFAPGETVKSVTVVVADDAVTEGDETFFLNLTGVTGGQGASLGNNQGMAIIARSDGPTADIPVLDVDDIVVGEGGGVASFTLRLSQPSASTVSVVVGTVGGTATTSSNDYSPLAGVVVSFAPGETAKQVSVPITDDTAGEALESLFLNLSSPQGLVLGRSTVAATIVDNDTVAPAPNVLIDDTVVNEGDGLARFTLRLDHATATPVTVTYQTADGSALAGSDYTALTSSVTFAPGETAKSLAIVVADDVVAERDETFFLNLTGVTGGQGASLGNSQGMAIIARSDGPTADVPVLNVDDIVVGEGGGVARFTLRLSQPSASTVSVVVGTAGGTATTSGNDYSPLTGVVVTLAPGQTVKEVSVPITDDTTSEALESLFLLLSSPLGLVLGRSTVTATIVDNDTVSPAPHVLIDDTVVNEGDGLARFTLRLDHATTTPVTVTYQTADGSALAGSDYTALTSSVTFAPGETAKSLAIVVADDAVAESDETFLLKLSGVTGGQGASLGSSQGVAIIARSDGPTADVPVLNVDDIVVGEGDGLATFTLRLSQPSASTVSVVVGTAGGTATTSDNDYSSLAGVVVSFAAGETAKEVSVPITDDATSEALESLSLLLSSPQGLVLGRSSAAITIVDNDGALPAVWVTPVTAARQQEGDQGTTTYIFAVKLSFASLSAQTVDWTISGGTQPVDGADFAGGALPSGTVTFAPGETSKAVAVTVAGDTTLEPDESFLLTLSGASAGLSIGVAAASGTILTDDGAALAISALLAVRAEGNGATSAFTFSVNRTGDVSVSHSVAWAVTGRGVNPVDAADFEGGTLPAGTVTFAAGETSKTITINTAGDTTVESDEGFMVSLSNGSAGVVIGTASANGTIVNDDASVSLAALAAIKTEGNGGTTAFTFTAIRTGDTSVAHTVAYGVTGTGANPASASDFASGTLPAGTVTFAAGETSKTITINIAGDTTVEPDEGFMVSLLNGSAGVVIGTATASGRIVNDDASVSLTALAAIKAEGNDGTTAFTFTAVRTGDTSVAHTVAYGVTGTGANPASAADFTGGALPAGTVTFAAGETSKTVAINVAGDTTVEADEGFAVTLVNPSAGLTIGTPTAGGTITNDDKAVAIVAHDDAYIVLEGQSLNVPSTLSVLINDDNAATASLASGPAHGTLQLAANGAFSYSPSAGFTGIDQFTYHAGNSGSSVDAHGLLYVVPVSIGATTTLDLLALTAEQQIAATYAAFFGRAADAGGFEFWVGQFNAGLPTQGAAALFANIASSFGVSNEARSLYPFLVNPFGATDGQISAFLDSVYNNLFNRSSDAGGLAYWTGQIKATLLAGQFVGSVLVDIMGGAQATDITTLMGKVAVSLSYVHEQKSFGTQWTTADDGPESVALLHAVTAEPQTILTGIAQAHNLVAADLN